MNSFDYSPDSWRDDSPWQAQGNPASRRGLSWHSECLSWLALSSTTRTTTLCWPLFPQHHRWRQVHEPHARTWVKEPLCQKSRHWTSKVTPKTIRALHAPTPSVDPMPWRHQRGYFYLGKATSDTPCQLHVAARMRELGCNLQVVVQ